MSKKRKVIFLVITLILILTILGIFISKKENVINLIAYKTDENKRLDESISEDEEAAKTVDPSTWDKEKVTATTSNDGQTVPVPVGYVASSIKEERSVNTGFVIYEGSEEVNEENAKEMQTTRNQWVWVPVKDINRIYEVDKSGKMKGKTYHNYSNSSIEPTLGATYYREKYYIKQGMQVITADRLLKDLQKQFESTIKSIKKYGGFYIGRYETGDVSKARVVVQAMNTDLRNINWYEGYKKSQYLGANKNVQASMIWGCLWDETINWLIDSGGKTKEEVENMKRWGNFENATFSYTDSNNYTQTKEIDSYKLIPTGSTDYTKANNIYDLVGNVAEWTLEGRKDSGTFWQRGGDYANTLSVKSAFDTTSTDPASHSVFCGVRTYFYIK